MKGLSNSSKSKEMRKEVKRNKILIDFNKLESKSILIKANIKEQHRTAIL